MIDQLFLIQVFVSFIVGGSFVALLTFLAERSNKFIAGLIIAFPSTAAIGLFFLGLTTSASDVSAVIPTSLIPFGLSVLFIASYGYVAKFIASKTNSKLTQILVTSSMCIFFWFLLSIPIVSIEFTQLWVGLVGYVILAFSSHCLIRRQDGKKPVALTYTLGQKVFRSVFVGFVISLVVLFAKISNPFIGGLFALFPAVFTSVLVILHWYYGAGEIFPFIQNVPVGTLSLLAYLVAVYLFFPVFGYVYGTIVSYFVSLLVSLSLMWLQKGKD